MTLKKLLDIENIDDEGRWAAQFKSMPTVADVKAAREELAAKDARIARMANLLQRFVDSENQDVELDSKPKWTAHERADDHIDIYMNGTYVGTCNGDFPPYYLMCLLRDANKTTELESLLKRFLDSQDSDWWVECSGWKPDVEYETSMPIGLIRDIEAHLNGTGKKK